MLPLATTFDSPTAAALILLAAVLGVLIWIAALLLRMLAGDPGSGAAQRTAELLERIEGQLETLLKDQAAGLDLRRVEHLLADLREGQKRQARAEQTAAPAAVWNPATGDRSLPLADRITARLLAQGFERIELLVEPGEWAQLEGGDGEVRVEARRAGSPYKGRVQIEGGRIGDL
ncbi:MAG: hypothetical protein R3F17_17560, partial [Planctomycetota bacterium]